MKKNATTLYIAAAFLLLSASAFAQQGAVGINTDQPKATLDVAASPNINSRVDGFIAPRLKGSELKGKDGLYTSDQDGAIVYVTEAVSSVTDKTTNVTSVGYYYFDKLQGSGGRWMKIANPSAVQVYQEPWHNVSDEQPATSNTEAIYQMASVGIGAKTPQGRLHVETANGGTDNKIAYFTAPNMGVNDDAIIKLGKSNDGNSNMADIKYTYKNDKNNSSLSFGFSGGQPQVNILGRGFVGIGTDAAANPTNALHVNNGIDPVRFEGLQTGTTTNQIVTIDDNGVLKKVAGSTFNAIYQEPWNDMATQAGATSNTQDIYQMGKVAIGINSTDKKFQVNTTDHSANDVPVLITSPNMVVGDQSVIKLGKSDDGNSNLADIKYNYQNSADNSYLGFGFSGVASQMVLLGKGFLGLGTVAPTNKLHINSGADPLRLEGLVNSTDPNDILTVDPTGVVKKMYYSSLAASAEPWFDNVTKTGATGNTQDIYQMGKVAIGINSTDKKFQVNTTDHSANDVPVLITSPNMVVGDQSVIKLGKSDDGNSNLADIKYNYQNSPDKSYLGFGFSGSQTKMTLTGKGFVGIGTDAAANPTNALHVNNGIDPVRFEGLQAGASTNQIVTVDDNGVLKKVSGSTFNATYQEPWYTQGASGNAPATANNQAIYQNAAVAIKKTTGIAGADLDVNGSIRGGQSSSTAAVGTNSFAVGYNSAATSTDAVAIGVNAASSGSNSSVALGYNTIARSKASYAMGNGAQTGKNASGDATVQADHSYAIGEGAQTGNTNAYALGKQAQADGSNSVALGQGTLVTSNNEVAVGKFNNDVSNAALVVGIGTASARKNALAVMYNTGNVGVGTDAPTNTLHVAAASNPVKLEGLQNGASGDQIVTVDGSGVLRKVSGSTFNATYQEPWLNVTGASPATSNTADIYQMANIGIGTTTPSARLHVNTPNHGGDEKIAYFTAPNMVNGDVSVIKFGQADSGSNNAVDLRYKLTNDNATKAFQIGFSGNQPQVNILGKGFVGIGTGASVPTNALHVNNGNDPVRFEGLQAGASTNQIVTVDDNGVLKKVSGSTFNATYQEPWNVQGGTTAATLNSSNVYQTGSVAIGKNTVYTSGSTSAKFDVAGAARVGDSQAGTVGVNSFASGYGNTASGDSASAFGVSNTASGKASFAAGTSNTASAEHSFAVGNTNTVTATTAAAIGSRNQINAGGGSTAFGVQNIISGDYSSAIGMQNNIGSSSTPATASYAIGYANKLLAAHSSYAFGANATTVYPGEIQIGNSPISNNSTDLPAGMITSSHHIAFGVGGYEPSSYNIQMGTNILTVFNDGFTVIGKTVTGGGEAATKLVPNGSEKLKVLGGIYAEGAIRAQGSFYSGTSSWPDYVLEDYVDGTSTLKNDYRRLTLDEVEAFIKVNKHLPGVTGIKDIEKDATGKYSVNITETSRQTLEKVEELYLHTIEQQKEIETLKEIVKAQQAQINKLINR